MSILKIDPSLLSTAGASDGQVLAYNASTNRMEFSAGGGGVVVYANANDLPLSNNTVGDQAYVTATNRLYLWTGTGWYNIALINTNPTITQSPNATYKLQTDGSPTVIELIASDPEGLPITWSFQVTGGTLGNIATISQNNNVFTITPSTNTDDIGTFTVTFTVTDGINISSAISSFSLFFSAADQYYNQSIMLTTSAVNNGNNNTFIDSSTNNFTLTRNGNVTQGTFSPYGDRWSNYFYQDRITTPSDTSLSMQSGDFTFECWYYPTGKIAAYPRIFQFGSAEWGTSDNLAILDRHDDASTKFSVAIYNLGGNSILLQSSTVVQDNVWYHISLTREGSTFRLFINGVLESTYTNSGAISTSSSIVGQIGGQGAANAWNAGYISDLRIIKGTALYTSNFTPSVEPLTAVSNTSLLTCQSNRFKDSSSNNFTLTMFGDVKITPFSPYIPNNPYNPAINGGSGYFVSATGNYLSAGTSTTLALGDGDFCIECWIYITAYNSNASVIFDYRTNGGSPSNIPALTLGTNGQPNFYFQVASPVMNGSKVVPLNAWTHLAIVRNGTATNNCTMYMNGESIATATNTSNLGIETLAINNPQTAANYNQVGWFAEFRIVKGSPVYTGTFTPPTAPLTAITNTSLLLNFTNANIYDETGKVTLETVGDAKVSTSVVKYGDGSIAFDGTGDYLLIPNSTEIDFGTGNFTIEMWLNLADVTSTWQAIISRAYTITGGWRLYKTSGLNQLTWYVGSSAAVTTTNGHLTNNTWSHVAVVRNNGVISIYIDGVSRGSASNTTNFNPGNYALEIGSGVVTSAYPITGYISDLRITKGIARYTTNFTPPTQKLGYSNDE